MSLIVDSDKSLSCLKCRIQPSVFKVETDDRFPHSSESNCLVIEEVSLSEDIQEERNRETNQTEQHWYIIKYSISADFYV